MSWESIELFANKLLPNIKVYTPEQVATPVVDPIAWVDGLRELT